MLRRLPLPVLGWSALLALLAVQFFPGAPVHVPLHELVAHAWRHRALLLDRWAGPAFTFWASPWTAFGMQGLQWANLVCFVLTCGCAAMLFRPREAGAAFLYPVLLLAAPAYRDAFFAGTNEPFFILLSTAVLVALWQRHTWLAALLASFLPLVRPEWLVVLPCVAIWLTGLRAWRALPWLLSGTALYAMLGGEGPWGWKPMLFAPAGQMALLHHAGMVFMEVGRPLIVGLCIAVVAWAVAWRLQAGERGRLRFTMFLGLAPAILIMTMHTVWGWLGREMPTAGERPWAVAWPLAALFVCHAWAVAAGGTLRSPVARWAGALLVIALAGVLAWPSAAAFPAQAGAERPGLRSWLQERTAIGPVVSINDPFWAHRFGLDPWMGWSYVDRRAGPVLAGDEQLLWLDTTDTPTHLRAPLDRLLTDDRLRLIGLEHFAPDPYDTIPPLAVWAFTTGPERRHRDTVPVFHGTGHPQIVHRLSLDTSARQYPGRPCFPVMEFPVEFADLPINTPEFHATEVIVAGVMQADSARLEWVIAEEGDAGMVGYWPHAVWSGPFQWRMALPARGSGVHTKLYIWNRTDQPFCIADLSVQLIRTFKGQ